MRLQDAPGVLMNYAIMREPTLVLRVIARLNRDDDPERQERRLLA
jgi:hypothetical protein